MSVVLQTGVMYYRENEQDTWHPLILKAETDFSALIDPYDPTETKTWVVGEYCLYDNRFRRCIVQTSTPGVFDPTKWVETTIGDELEAVKASIASEATTRASEDTSIRNTLNQLGDDVTALDGRIDDAEDDIDDLGTETTMIENGIAVIVDGNKTMHPNGARKNSFVLVKNSTITGLTDGIYTATKPIPYNTSLDASYFASCQFGALNQRPYFRWYTGINAASYQNDDLKRATLIMAYVGSPTAGNNSTTTIWDFIGDGTSARVSNNDLSGSYQLAYIVYNKNTGTVNAGNGVLLAVFAIFDLLPDY